MSRVLQPEIPPWLQGLGFLRNFERIVTNASTEE
jgi:hypothetical protein